LAPAVYINRLLHLRCILEELAWTAQLPELAHLIRREDFPRPPQRLPRALTAQQDQLIQQELLRRNDLPSNIFLLLRHTGMRIGECVDLSYDCLTMSVRIVGQFTSPRQAEDGTNGAGGLVCL
jgi:integrase